MFSAVAFLLYGAALATVLSLAAWMRHRRPRSPLRSIDDFQETLRALSTPSREPPRPPV